MWLGALELLVLPEPAGAALALACSGLARGARAVERRAALAHFTEWSALALAAHVVLGMAGGLYERSALYDKLVHLTLSFGLARLTQRTLLQYVACHSLTPGVLLLRWVPVLAAVALGTAWELFEFAADASGLVHAQRGLGDTMLDLAADVLGALAAAWVGDGLLGREGPCRVDNST
jgi:hypothetical protein